MFYYLQNQYMYTLGSKTLYNPSVVTLSKVCIIAQLDVNIGITITWYNYETKNW